MAFFNRILTVLVLVFVWLGVVLLAAVPEIALGWAWQGLDRI